MLYLGASQYDWEGQEVKNKFYEPTIGKTFGTFAMAYKREALVTILNELDRMDCAFDQMPVWSVIKKFPKDCFVAYPNLVIADVSSSSIREDRDLNLHAERMRWDLADYNF